MKNIRIFFTVLVALFAFAFTSPVYDANFSGTWKLNEGKSDLGQFGSRGAAGKIVVDQKADGVTTTRTSTGFNGQSVDQVETLNNDGKEVGSSVFNGMGKRKASVKWSADKNTMTVNATTAFEGNGQSFEIKVTETWSLSADGKTLTLSSVMTTPQGELTTKAVYDKQ